MAMERREGAISAMIPPILAVSRVITKFLINIPCSTRMTETINRSLSCMLQRTYKFGQA
jgi:hypothetical protein